MASPVKDAKAHHQGRGFTQVHSRGRGHLISRNPGTDQYAITTQVGNRGWHRGNGPYTEADEVDTAWVANGPNYEMLSGDPYEATVSLAQQSYRYQDMDSGEWVELFAESVLQWVNDTGDTETAAGLSAPTTSVDDDTITFEGLFGTGSRLAIQAQTARLAKLLTLDNDTILSTPTIGGVVDLAFSLRFQRSNGVTIWIDGVQWDEKGNNPQTTAAAIEFRDVGNNTLFVFDAPYATDSSDGEQQPGTMHLRKTGANLWAEVRIPHAWIDSAVYPVVIDPTIDPTIGAGNDDGYWDSSLIRGLDYTILGDWAGGLQSTFHLFAISGPSGATCTTAYVTFTAWTNDSGTTLNAYVAADDSNSPSAYTTVSAASSATETTTTVSWTPGAWTQNATTNAVTPEIKTIIQELWDSGYGEDGENIIIRIRDNTSDSGAQRIAWSYDGDTSKDAVLHIEYTAPGGDPEGHLVGGKLLTNSTLLVGGGSLVG